MVRHLRRFLRIYQGFVLSGALFLLSVGALVAGVIPGIRATISLYYRLRSLEQEVRVLGEKRGHLQSLDAADLKKQVAALIAAVPQEKSLQTIVGTIDGLANQTGVVIDEMNLGNPGSIATGSATAASGVDKKIGANRLPFTISVSGDYGRVRAFIGKINAVRRLFDVSSFDVSPQGVGETRARISLTAYYQPLPTKIWSVETPLAPLAKKEEEVLRAVLEYPEVAASVGEQLTPGFSSGRSDPFSP